MNNENVLKLVSKKYPTCALIDCQDDDNDVVLTKCEQNPKIITVGQTKKRPGWDVLLCTGSFNVYVLDITQRSMDAE